MIQQFLFSKIHLNMYTEACARMFTKAFWASKNGKF